jgi:hypothetical protein
MTPKNTAWLILGMVRSGTRPERDAVPKVAQWVITVRYHTVRRWPFGPLDCLATGGVLVMILGIMSAPTNHALRGYRSIKRWPPKDSGFTEVVGEKLARQRSFISVHPDLINPAVEM